jgi:hypothetical protein
MDHNVFSYVGHAQNHCTRTVDRIVFNDGVCAMTSKNGYSRCSGSLISNWILALKSPTVVGGQDYRGCLLGWCRLVACEAVIAVALALPGGNLTRADCAAWQGDARRLLADRAGTSPVTWPERTRLTTSRVSSFKEKADPRRGPLYDLSSRVRPNYVSSGLVRSRLDKEGRHRSEHT